MIIVVSRVVVRNRREQFVLGLKNQAAAVADSDLQQPNRLANLIGPAQKRFQVFSNPFSLVKSAASSTLSRSRDSLKERRQQLSNWRQNRRHPSAPVPLKPAEVSPPSSDTIAPPASRIRNFAQSLKSNFAAKTSSTLASVKSARHSFAHRRAAASLRKTSSAAPMPLNTPVKKLKLFHQEKNRQTASEPSGVITPAPESPQENQREQNKRISRLFAREKEYPQTILEQASAALDSAQLDVVEELLIPYIVKNPRDAQAYMMLGQAATSRGDWEDALQAFQQVINLNPNFRGSYAALGHAAFKAGKMTRAIECLQQAHNHDPANRQVIEELLLIARHMDNVPMQKSLIAELTELETT